MGIQVRNVSKHFGSFEALKDVSLSVSDGELVALLGASGSGKTTLRRIIAGLEFPDQGTIFLNGEDASLRNASELVYVKPRQVQVFIGESPELLNYQI